MGRYQEKICAGCGQKVGTAGYFMGPIWSHEPNGKKCLQNQLEGMKDQAAEALRVARQVSGQRDQVVALAKEQQVQIGDLLEKSHEVVMQRNEVLAVLREIEWINESGCVYCGRSPMRGHKRNCIVGKVLKKYDKRLGR